MKNKAIKLITEQNSFLKSFEITADNKTKKFLNMTMRGKVIDEVKRMRAVALNDEILVGGFGIEAEYWFKTITVKINLLKKIDDYLSRLLIEKMNDEISHFYASLIANILFTIIILFVTIGLGFMIIRNISGNLLSYQKRQGCSHLVSYGLHPAVHR